MQIQVLIQQVWKVPNFKFLISPQVLPLLLVLGAQLEECGFWSSLSLTHPPSIYQILFESVPSPFLLSQWLSGPMISNLGCFQHLLISLPLVHVAKGCPQEKSNVPWEVQLFRHLDHNCPQGYAQEQASELKMLLTTDSVQGWGMCTVWSPGGASRLKPANGLEWSHPINPGTHWTVGLKVLGQARTLHNDQVINPRRRYNHCNYLCTQHMTFLMQRQILIATKGEINSNTIRVGDFNISLTPTDRSPR